MSWRAYLLPLLPRSLERVVADEQCFLLHPDALTSPSGSSAPSVTARTRISWYWSARTERVTCRPIPPDDAAWHGTLRDLHRALVPGGRLAFDTRDPRAQAWRRWTPRETRRHVVLKDGTAVEVWNEGTATTAGLVTFTLHFLFADGEELTSSASLRFRSEESIHDALRQTDLQIGDIRRVAS